MDALTLWMAVGFLFAPYSVSQTIQYKLSVHGLHQTMKSLIGRLCESLKGAVLLYTLWYGWYVNAGDISYGRLNKIPFRKFNGIMQWHPPYY